MVIMEVDKIGFCEQARNIRARVVNGFICIDAQNNFFIGLLPLLNLMDDIHEEYFVGIRFGNTLGLKNSDLLSRDCSGCHIKILVADLVAQDNDYTFVIFS